ncbi:MAG: hypothetical protein NC302_02055 [Bacteroidales bacterium]|nr:hypothetical protein [Bacteroidales bacterium]MCM1415789.1 hypothetical protein [bacterium]MCM1422717.1 hypothetical protein [bacterium]
MYVMGVDAGGTKTRCLICDEKERVMGRGAAGASQHQIYGIEQTKKNVRLAVEEALKQAKLLLSDISYAVLGMSGADEADDFALLIPAIEEVLPGVPHEILHDSWIGMRAAFGGTGERHDPECPAAGKSASGIGMFGVVSICGTGAGHAGINERGERLTLRNLDYITGNCGGGAELCEKALHYAFRSEEGTYDKSLLEERIPPVFGVRTMEEVCGIIKNDGPNEKQRFAVPVVVFEAAGQGDTVAGKLLTDMGREEGRYAAAIIRRLGMTADRIPAVLIGSLFQTGERLLIDAYMEEVHAAAPLAYPVILEEEPVLGAVRLALDAVRRKL